MYFEMIFVCTLYGAYIGLFCAKILLHGEWNILRLPVYGGH